MKILLIGTRYLPIFNTENRGAIEKLLRIYLLRGVEKKDTVVVYSPKISEENYDSKSIKRVTFRSIDTTTRKYKLSKLLFAIKKRITRSNNNECYIHAVARDLILKNEQQKYDLIIFENEEKNIPIFRKLIRTNTKIVLHLHNDYINVDTKDSFKIVKSCDEIWTVSDFVKNRVRELDNTKTIVTIPNTIDKIQTPLNTSNINQLRKKIGIKNKDLVFIYVGRLKLCKGIPQLLEAFKKYAKENKEAKLLLLGDVESSKEGLELTKLINIAKEQAPGIILLGYIEPKLIPAYQAIADYQIIPSVWNEAFGLVVLEAMASNLKIIASNTGGIPEIGLNTIEYVSKDNLVNDLYYALINANKNKLPNDYYKEILAKYSQDEFCNSFNKAINNALKGKYE